jgi:predicted membrane GTPase involved in stress response
MTWTSNITKEKKLTNMRSSTSDSFESMTPPRVLTLEESLEFARDDECVEVTPGASARWCSTRPSAAARRPGQSARIGNRPTPSHGSSSRHA